MGRRTVKGGREIGATDVDMKCSSCNAIVRADSQAARVLCYKCVAKQLNPHTIFVDDLSQEEWRDLIRKTYKKQSDS